VRTDVGRRVELNPVPGQHQQTTGRVSQPPHPAITEPELFAGTSEEERLNRLLEDVRVRARITFALDINDPTAVVVARLDKDVEALVSVE